MVGAEVLLAQYYTFEYKNIESNTKVKKIERDIEGHETQTPKYVMDNVFFLITSYALKFIFVSQI